MFFLLKYVPTNNLYVVEQQQHGFLVKYRAVSLKHGMIPFKVGHIIPSLIACTRIAEGTEDEMVELLTMEAI